MAKTQRRKSPSRKGSAYGVLAGVVMAAASAGIAQVGVTSQRGLPAPRPAAGSPLPEAFYHPDPLHPGAVNPSMDAKRICSPAFHTSSVRPSSSYTQRLKKLELGEGGSIKGPSGQTYTVEGEGLPGKIEDYELDHLISLQLGGDPEDPANLWMEPWEKKKGKLAAAGRGAESKDVVENRLHRQVCEGKISLDRAQTEIAEDWMSAGIPPA
jgi:hypothetical protein